MTTIQPLNSTLPRIPSTLLKEAAKAASSDPAVKAATTSFFASDTSKEVYMTMNENKTDTGYAFLFSITRQIEILQPQEKENMTVSCGKRVLLCIIHYFALPIISAGIGIIKLIQGTLQLGAAAYYQFAGAAEGKVKAKQCFKDAGVQFAYAGINGIVMLLPTIFSVFHAISPRLVREMDAQLDDFCERHVRARADQGAVALQEELDAVEALKIQRRELAKTPPYQKPGSLLNRVFGKTQPSG